MVLAAASDSDLRTIFSCCLTVSKTIETKMIETAGNSCGIVVLRLLIFVQ